MNWQAAVRLIQRADKRGWKFKLSGMHHDESHPYRCTFSKENVEITESGNTPEESVLRCKTRLENI